MAPAHPWEQRRRRDNEKIMMAERGTDLGRRAEEACFAAWPAPREVLLDGWLLRFADGHTRRANSVNVVAASEREAGPKVAACEALYRAQNLPTTFRLSTVWPQADLTEALDVMGYGPPEDESLVLYAGVTSPRHDSPSGIALTEGRPDAEWRAASAEWSRRDTSAASLHDRIIDALAVPAAFASVSVDGSAVAVAFGAVHDGLVCLNGVATAPAHRGRGLAGHAVSAVLDWAVDKAGATGACLQVVARNAPALALYRRLGFTTELSRYHYRTRRTG